MIRVLASCILFFWVTGIAADPSDREFRLRMMVGFGTYTRFFPYLNHESEILRATGRDGGATSTGWKKDASGVAFGLQFDFDRWRAELELGGTGHEDRQLTASRMRNTASEQSELHYLHARDIGRSGGSIAGGYRLTDSRSPSQISALVGIKNFYYRVDYNHIYGIRSGNGEAYDGFSPYGRQELYLQGGIAGLDYRLRTSRNLEWQLRGMIYRLRGTWTQGQRLFTTNGYYNFLSESASSTGAGSSVVFGINYDIGERWILTLQGQWESSKIRMRDVNTYRLDSTATEEMLLNEYTLSHIRQRSYKESLQFINFGFSYRIGLGDR